MPALRPLLVCPICGKAMPDHAGGRQLACPDGHRFDAAKQGYFNLLTGSGTRFKADTADMVQARVDFLAAGHYAPLAAALTAAARRSVPGAERVLDAGAGTGYYLAEVAAGLQARSIGLDISKYALRRAARALPEGLHLVWDVWRRLPLADESVDVVLNVFAPRNPREFRRVLSPGGALLVVTPRAEHLMELRTLAGLLDVGSGKEEQVEASLGEEFFLESTEVIVDRPQLTAADLRNAALMGPSAHHLDASRLDAAVAALGSPVAVTTAFNLQMFRRS